MKAGGKIGVVVTGGTIGMQAGDAGLAPAAGLAARLRETLCAHGRRDVGPFVELAPLIDSANAGPEFWVRVAAAVVSLVEESDCRGVLVLHGTDTMAYTAAGLAFLLLGLPVPVVLTGAMHPIGVAGSDGWDNLSGALDLLAGGPPAGITVYFAGRQIPAVHCSKWRTRTTDAFTRTLRPTSDGPAPAQPPWSYRKLVAPARVAVLPLHPGFEPTALEALVAAGVPGCVLECYGSGTAPVADLRFIAALELARSRNTVVVATSQCPEGAVAFGHYATDHRLKTAGVVSGGGMTREVALAKLGILLGAGLPAAACRDWMGVSVLGEI
ncbi:asparaginase domain-containing protein [Bradyrhizobium stylosanthis]|uniref:L-asparaginase n=1 Tax=Bradyrhizobium stylosanthis TaxID=1803665 RepID=A0A560D6B7_9BRAD|nr:asparaginase domain-containing protein [Bradyrhizobium stylosanthis]TWA92628.1 L-asparaginase [Bradyrhizobium stylosanthis]